MKPKNIVHLGEVPVGDGHKTVFMAETSTFFNQDIDLAKKYVRSIFESGAEIFKTEILHDPEICIRASGLISEYSTEHGANTEEYRYLIDRKVLSLDEYAQILGQCKELSVPFVCSVYDIEGVDFLVDVGAVGIKIARDSIFNMPLISYASATGLPLIFDAGGIHIDETSVAVRTAQESGDGGVILNHHPGSNPASPESHNLRLIDTYKSLYKIPVGFSCHFVGNEMIYVAIGMGANIIEKGVVDNPARKDQDLISAVPLQDLSDVIVKVKECSSSLGNSLPDPVSPRDNSRGRCVVTKKSIKKGEPVNIDNVRFSWPPVGISVSNWDLINGSIAVNNMDQNHVIGWADICIQESNTSFQGRVTRT